MLFAEASDGELKKLANNLAQRNAKKSIKYKGNDLRAFALRNYSEGYTINKPLSGWLVYQKGSLLGQLFIFRTIFQPWPLSSDITDAEKGLFTKYIYTNIINNDNDDDNYHFV